MQRKILIAILSLSIITFNLLPSAAAGEYERELDHCLIQARIQYDNLRYENALKWWEKALILDPKNKEALRYIKKVQEKIYGPDGKPTEPVATEPSPDKMPTKLSKMKVRAGKYILQGKKYYCNHRYEWAIDDWKKALLIDPGNTEVAEYIERAEARLKEKPAERKPVEFNMRVKLPPKSYEPVFAKPTKDVLMLQDAIDLGVENHLPLQIAREQMKLAKFKERETFRELFPQLTVRWDESSGIVSSKDFVGRKYQLKVQQPIYNAGELQYTWEQAKLNLKISRENYEKTKLDYELEALKAYYDLVKAMKNFQIQETLLKDLENDVSIAKKEFDAGLTTMVDSLNVQSQYNQAYYSYLSSENSLALAKSNFAQILNLDKESGGDLKVDTQMPFKELKLDLENCLGAAYENRADLRINELNLKSAEFGEKVAKSQALPKVDLTGSIGRSGEAYVPDTIKMSDDWFVGARVNIPWGPNTMNYSYTAENIAPTITAFSPTRNTVNSVRFNVLDNLAGYTEAKRSEVTKQQAYSDMLKGKQTAATEVREAYFNYQESLVKVKNSLASRELYQKELAIVKEKRLINEAQTQDVVASKVKLAAEEANYNSVVVENIIALAKLNKAMGIKDYFKS